MKSLHLLCFILLTSAMLSQDNSLLYDYPLQTYSYRLQTVQGQDFLSFIKFQDFKARTTNRAFNADLSYTENYVQQTPQRTSKTAGFINYHYRDSLVKINRTERSYISSNLLLLATSSHQWYPWDVKGLHINTAPEIEYLYLLRDKLKFTFANLPVSVGYGRVISVKSVTQAYIISDELNAAKSRDALYGLAGIIEQYENGYYHATYQDSADIRYYQAIAEATGRNGADLKKIEQILSSGLYKTSSRYTGWQVRAGVNSYLLMLESLTGYNNTGNSGTYEGFSDFAFLAEYALPIGFDKQLLASVSYSTPFTSGKYLTGGLSGITVRAPHIDVALNFSVDHNYNWASSVGYMYTRASLNADSKKAIGVTDDAVANQLIYAKSDYMVLNAMSVYGLLQYQRVRFLNYWALGYAPSLNEVNTESLAFHIGFNYYIK